MTTGIALIWATFDGITSRHYGIGVQAHSFITHVGKKGAGTEAFDSVYLAYPLALDNAAGAEVYEDVHDESLRRMRECEVTPIALPFSGDALWSSQVWDQLCSGLTGEIGRLLLRHEKVVVIGVDDIYAGLWDALSQDMNVDINRVRVVHAIYSTGLLRGYQRDFRVEIERRCVELANLGKVSITDVGKYFTSHLRSAFGLKASLPRFFQSLVLDDPDLSSVDADWARKKLDKAGIPTDRPLVIFAGRSDPIKGTDVLIDALRGVRRDFVFVALSVPYFEGDPNLQLVQDQLAGVSYEYRLFTQFSRDLFRALVGHSNTVAAVVPSRDEPVGLIPQEVALWAESQGAICIASDVGGLAEQIEDGDTGFLAPSEDSERLTGILEASFELSPSERDEIRRKAAAKVRRERDYDKNFEQLVDDLGLLK